MTAETRAAPAPEQIDASDDRLNMKLKISDLGSRAAFLAMDHLHAVGHNVGDFLLMQSTPTRVVAAASFLQGIVGRVEVLRNARSTVPDSQEPPEHIHDERGVASEAPIC